MVPLLMPLLMLLPLVVAAPAHAYTPESPEVVALVDQALTFLEKNTDERLGARCLVGLAFHKRGMPATHPRIREAVEACRTSIESERTVPYTYSKALAIIFLSELDARAHGDLIRSYVELLEAHRKSSGGYGYTMLETGDTSQTQYAALAYWEMLNNGISPDAKSVQQCLGWLLRTQDPTGVWGYQGVDPGSYALTTQTDRPGRSMGAAGMSSTLILGNALGILTAGGGVATPSPSDEIDLPAALRRKEEEGAPKRAPTLPAGGVSPQLVKECLQRATGWWGKNFGLEVDEYQYYYLYSLERLKSFEEYLAGGEHDESAWYNQGVDFLIKTKAPDGHWTDGCGDTCATAFATLFLLRSTQQSIKRSLGEGTLVGGRGLPRDLSKVRLRGGKIVVQQQATELDQLLEMMDDGAGGDLDGLIDNPAALEVTEVTPEAARRLQQIVRSGAPHTRLLAVRALAAARDLEYAPTLIFALTDPDRQVVRAARDGLRSVSRNFAGLGPSDNFDEGERQQAIVRWKAWYAAARPDAPPLP
ncbi:MAG TPA: prenyltransferase/squalene oxidase repeat-containing protein [Lacipirellulaceae bacterium]|nr:prenyltransferase/squalene oxidase repeat-containing protein [Lacipirellulaceae bacterium]